jgi:hypothetical protein
MTPECSMQRRPQHMFWSISCETVQEASAADVLERPARRHVLAAHSDSMYLLCEALVGTLRQQVGPDITQHVHQQQLALQCCCVVVVAHRGGEVLILAPCSRQTTLL